MQVWWMYFFTSKCSFHYSPCHFEFCFCYISNVPLHYSSENLHRGSSIFPPVCQCGIMTNVSLDWSKCHMSSDISVKVDSPLWKLDNHHISRTKIKKMTKIRFHSFFSVHTMVLKYRSESQMWDRNKLRPLQLEYNNSSLSHTFFEQLSLLFLLSLYVRIGQEVWKFSCIRPLSLSLSLHHLFLVVYSYLHVLENCHNTHSCKHASVWLAALQNCVCKTLCTACALVPIKLFAFDALSCRLQSATLMDIPLPPVMLLPM